MNAILKKYSELMAAVDKKTAEVYGSAPEIPCKNKCFDCCKQLFPVSFVEAYYISEGIKTLDAPLRRKMRAAAEKINKKILAQNPFQFERAAADKKTALNTHAQFAQFLHKIESDCPALTPENPSGACGVYEFRNHDCRSMGFAFDATEKAIVGCFRFESLKYLAPKLMDFGFRYPEKMALDRELLAEVTGGALNTPGANILYYTTMCGPLLKDYAETDWLKFFSDKKIPHNGDPEKYWVVIDV